MNWEVKKRRIGRAGGKTQRHARQKEWNKKYGEDNWSIGYLIDGEFVDQESALDQVYYQSYVNYFEQNPQDLQELVTLAKVLRNPHADATTGVDLQTPAILRYLKEQDLELQGREVVDIGSWHGQASHPISIRLSPLHIKCCIKPEWTLEKWWQEEKCLAVWE